jgi:hypothetical protein
MVNRTLNLVLGLTLLVFAGSRQFAAAEDTPPGQQKWRALHLTWVTSDKALETLGREVPKLSTMGLNVLVLEVNYSFAYKSHPELRQRPDGITPAGAEKFAALCKQRGIRVIPQFQALGHQSWKGNTSPLLRVYPQLDLTPGAFPGNNAYPSIPMMLEKGFCVLPASWRKLDASKALIEYSLKLQSPGMLGHLFTTWSGRQTDVTTYAPLVQGLKLLQ